MSTPSKRSLKESKPYKSGRLPNKPEDLLKRYIVNNAGCWIYNGATDRYGYGQFRYFGYNGHRAHVVSWMLHNGDIPAELVLDHTCAVRNCINPKHLRLVTAKENTLDGISRKPRSIMCKYGHKDYGDRNRKHVRCMECDRERHRTNGKKFK